MLSQTATGATCCFTTQNHGVIEEAQAAMRAGRPIAVMVTNVSGNQEKVTGYVDSIEYLSPSLRCEITLVGVVVI